MRTFLRGQLAQWIRKRQGPDTLPLILARSRLYILPTRTGVGFALLLLFMLVAGLNYANSTALFLTFLLAGFTLVNMHMCHRNLQGTRLLSASAQPAFAGREGTLVLNFENSASAPRFRIGAAVGDGPQRATDLPAAARTVLQLPVPAPKRGRLKIDRLYVVTTHPFGLFRTWTWIHAPLEMMVYPRPQGLLLPPTFHGRKLGARSMPMAGTDEWMGLRPFRDGDSPRQVDWKAYAREAPLLIREYASAGADLRIFDFDALGGLPLEGRLEQLARWIVDAEATGERYGLNLPIVRIMPDRGPEHRHRCLSELAMFGLEPHAETQGA
jgi:uncharacterized protein (DUF58 family)